MSYVRPYAGVNEVTRTSSAPKRRYSVTADILSFRRCRRQYGYEAVHGYQPSRTSQVFYGTIIHQVLDRAHAQFHGLIDSSTRGALPTDDDIAGYFEEVRQSLRTRGVRGARAEVEEQALRILQLFNRIEGPELYPRVVDSEHRMQADDGSYVLHGTVDLLASSSGSRNGGADSLEIWDYKGSKRPSTHSVLFRDYLFQMRVYAELYRRRHGVFPVRANVYFLNELDDDGRSLSERRASAQVTVDFSDSEVEEALRAFQDTVAAIEDARSDDKWDAPAVGSGPGLETCTICDFRWNCPTVVDDPLLHAKIPIRYP